MNLMRFLPQLALVISTAWALPTRSVQAQMPSELSSAETARKERLRRSALTLLEQSVEQIPDLKSSENRLLLKLMAADLLWKEDEKRARSLYEEVASEFIGRAAASSDQKSVAGDAGSPMARLHYDIVESMAKHDLRLALKFARAVGAQASDVGQRNLTRELELKLALQLADNDPKQAAEVARQSLDKGLSSALQDVVLKLTEKDPAVAAAFVKEVEAKLLGESFGDGPESVAVAIALIRMGAAHTAAGGESRAGQNTRTVVTHQTVQNLLARLVSQALSSAEDEPELLSALQSVAPEIQEYVPERLPLLKKRFRGLDSPVDSATRVLNEYQQLIQEGTTDELLNAITKAPADARDLLYQQAAWKALREDDADRARQIASELISAVSVRDQILSQAEWHSLHRAADGGKVSEIREMLSRLRTDEEKVSALARCADALAARNEKEAALQLLNEAQVLASSPVKNLAQLDARMLLAHAYARVDPEQGFKMMARIIDQVNMMVAAAAVLDGFINTQGAFIDDELLLRSDGGVVNSVFFKCAAELVSLARTDLDRARDLADKFERPEAALAARMLLAQGILLPPHRAGAPKGK